MADFIRKVLSLDCDFHSVMPPSELTRVALGYCMESVKAAGGGPRELFEAFGAVWMITRLRMRQFALVRAGDELVYRTYPRCRSGAKYICTVDILRGEETVAIVDGMYIPVDCEKRTLIPIKAVDALWKHPAAEQMTNLFPRIKACGNFTAHSKRLAQMSDCDPNKHVTTTRYIAMVCDCVGFWDEGNPKVMKDFQIDFTREVLPGETINFTRWNEDGKVAARGQTDEGSTQFTAVCEF